MVGVQGRARAARHLKGLGSQGFPERRAPRRACSIWLLVAREGALRIFSFASTQVQHQSFQMDTTRTPVHLSPICELQHGFDDGDFGFAFAFAFACDEGACVGVIVHGRARRGRGSTTWPEGAVQGGG